MAISTASGARLLLNISHRKLACVWPPAALQLASPIPEQPARITPAPTAVRLGDSPNSSCWGHQRPWGGSAQRAAPGQLQPHTAMRAPGRCGRARSCSPGAGWTSARQQQWPRRPARRRSPRTPRCPPRRPAISSTTTAALWRATGAAGGVPKCTLRVRRLRFRGLGGCMGCFFLQLYRQAVLTACPAISLPTFCPQDARL